MRTRMAAVAAGVMVAATVVAAPAVAVNGDRPPPVRVTHYQDMWPCQEDRVEVRVRVPSHWNGRVVRHPVIKSRGNYAGKNITRTRGFTDEIRTGACGTPSSRIGGALVFSFRWRAAGIPWSQVEWVALPA